MTPSHLYTLVRRDDHAWDVDPTGWTGSPWSADAQHGAPVSTLVAHLAEASIAPDGGGAWRLTRSTVELLRPVPRRPLVATVLPRRDGRRLRVVDVELVDPERATVVGLGRSVWTADAGSIEVSPGPIAVAPWSGLDEVDFISGEMRRMLPPGFHRSLRMRTALRPTPVIWLRSQLDGLTEGDAFTTGQRFAGLADMATVAATRLRAASTGVSPADADLGMHLVNADLTLHLSRPPVGEWVGFTDGRVEVAEGAGAATVRVLDELGPVGRSTHTVVASGR